MGNEISALGRLRLSMAAHHKKVSMISPLKVMIIFFHLQVVVTGVGIVSPVGIGAQNAYQALCDGKSGIRRLPSWADEFPAQVFSSVIHRSFY